jgi:osmotically-inducible protein OsmY
MTNQTRFLRPLLLALAFSAGLIAQVPTAPAASNFDGQWSVLIITENGTCDRAYRYPVTVTNGVLSYQGEAGVTLSGRVDAGGKLNATIQRGEQSANGFGRLSASKGSGTWKGKSSTADCSGIWQAERRAG